MADSTNPAANPAPTPAPQTASPASPAPAANPSATNPAVDPAKKFTQEDLDNAIKDRLDRAEQSFLKKAGVSNFEELGKKLSEGNSAKIELILTKNNIADDRHDDVITHFKGKGQELTEQALAETVKTHPEWLKKVEKPGNPAPQVKVGQSENPPKPQDDIAELNKAFGTHIGTDKKHILS